MFFHPQKKNNFTSFILKSDISNFIIQAVLVAQRWQYQLAVVIWDLAILMIRCTLYSLWCLYIIYFLYHLTFYILLIGLSIYRYIFSFNTIYYFRGAVRNLVYNDILH